MFSTTENDIITFSLEKPLGMILEEVEEGEPKGVYVLELADEGSATSFPEIVGLQIETVMDEDVTNLLFDDVMAKLIDAPSPVSVAFLKKDETDDDALDFGTPVKLNVIDGDKEVTIDAKVGDNLRQVLLENDLEVYKGLKQKLGNCGGGGQCGFCSVEVDGAWEERSEYEDKKLKNSSPKSRLSCMNNIQGPANIKL